MNSKRGNNNADLCICKLCTCGRHHCPHQPMRKAPYGPCTISEYTNEYHAHRLPEITSFKPLAVYKRSGVPLEDKTNHRADFVPHPLEKRYVHQQDAYVPPEGEFASNTSYTSEFVPKKGERTKMFKREEQKEDKGKFEGVPMYTTDFKKWPISPRELHGNNAEWMPPTESFGGVPTYTSDYIKYNDVTPREGFRPNENTKASNLPFDGTTNYRQSYTQQPLERRSMKEKVEWYPPIVPFKGDSTTHSDYIEKQLSINPSYKPLATAKMSSAPLQNDTTHRHDYQPWGIEKPYVHIVEPYQRPEGNMVSDTTYIRDYIPYKATGRIESFMPKFQKSELEKFQGKTSYSDDYKKWGIGPRKLYGPQREYMPPEEPFESKTTHNLHYVTQPMGERVSYKKSNQIHASNAPFDGNTIYRTEYQAHEQDICPAVLLNTPRASYEFSGQKTTEGHLLVAPKKSNAPQNEQRQIIEVA